MRDELKDRLAGMGADKLTEALLELADSNPDAAEAVERLTSTPEEKIKRFKAKLTELKQETRYVSWNEAAAFSRELYSVLQLLEDVSDPNEGIRLILAFYKTDEAVFERCDDSNGEVGSVFFFGARDLFAKFASGFHDKNWLIDQIFILLLDDNYCVRESMLEGIGHYLGEKWVRKLIDKLWNEADRREEGDRSHMIMLVRTLAKEIKDPDLFEKAVRAAHPEDLPVGLIPDIAEVYLDSGNPEIALSWLEKPAPGEISQINKREDLLRRIYLEMDDRENLTPVAWRIFRRHRDIDSLAALIETIGRDQWEASLADEVKLIQGDVGLSLSDATFLFDLGLVNEAEAYVFTRREQLKGGHYSSILRLAEKFEEQARYLVVTILYRALLDSVLGRGATKYYRYGVEYLRKLEQLSNRVNDWCEIPIHPDYFKQLREKHGRKYSFWSGYDG